MLSGAAKEITATGTTTVTPAPRAIVAGVATLTFTLTGTRLVHGDQGVERPCNRWPRALISALRWESIAKLRSQQIIAGLADPQWCK